MDPCVFFVRYSFTAGIFLNKGSSGRFVSGAVYSIPGPRPNRPIIGLPLPSGND